MRLVYEPILSILCVMVSFTKVQKLAIGLGAVSGAAIYYLTSQSDNKTAHLSWTTNYTPSTKWDENWDRRSPKSTVHPKYLDSNKLDNITNEKIENATTRATRHLILIRHGQYNLEGATDKQRILTSLGRMQAEATGARLKKLALPYSNMIKSTMARAQETGDLIAKALPQLPTKDCDLLREGAPIPPEPPVGHWRPEAHFFQDGARIEAAFREYFHRASPNQEKDTYTILVCHANVIRYFVCRALQFPPEAWLRLSLNHASITWLSITPSGRVLLRTLGDSGHMPPDMITSR